MALPLAIAVAIDTAVNVGASSALAVGASYLSKNVLKPAYDSVSGYIDDVENFYLKYNPTTMMTAGVASLLLGNSESVSKNVTSDVPSVVDSSVVDVSHTDTVSSDSVQSVFDYNVSRNSDQISLRSKLSNPSLTGENLIDVLKNSSVASANALNTHTLVMNQNSIDLNTSILALQSSVSDLVRLKSFEIDAISSAPVADIHIDAPIVNVPDVNVAPTTVNVESPTVNVAPELTFPSDINGYLSGYFALQNEAIPKQMVKDDLKIESLEYNKTAVSVPDLDGNFLTSVSPRELVNVKNASNARTATDTNTFELDDEDFDIMSFPDISSIFHFKTANEDIESLYNQFKGVSNE